MEISRIRIDSIFEIGASSITQATEIFKTSTIDDQRAFTGMRTRDPSKLWTRDIFLIWRYARGYYDYFLFQTPVFYFSYTYDLTNSQQRLASFHYAAHNNRHKSAAENQKHYRTPSSSMSTLNSTFAWNYNILRPFLGKVRMNFGTGIWSVDSELSLKLAISKI